MPFALNLPTPLTELSRAGILLVMLSLPSFDALRDICNIPGFDLPTQLLHENLSTIALSIAQNQSGPEIWSDMYTLVTARTRNLGPPATATVGGEEVEFGVEEVRIFEETLDTLKEWHEVIVPLILSQQQRRRRRRRQTRSKSKPSSGVLKLSGATPALSEFIPIDKALLRYWTILIACVPEACATDHSLAKYSLQRSGYASRLARYTNSHRVRMEYYLGNFGYAEWAFEVFRGADEDEIRAVWEVGKLCSKTGLGHLEEVVETVLTCAPPEFERFDAEILLTEIANVHLKHMARVLGVEIGWKE
ncbi:hypothetical protein HOY80DRAFT_998902 [Tuber brumale]|nr:hypothetical protein HOY80DRAFT_998902 [Tuber brumale]